MAFIAVRSRETCKAHDQMTMRGNRIQEYSCAPGLPMEQESKERRKQSRASRLEVKYGRSVFFCQFACLHFCSIKE